MAHIRKLEANRWQARYRDPGDRRERSRNFATKAAAQRWLDQVTAGLVRGDYADPKAGRVTVGEYAERWFSSTTALKPSTRNSYRSLLDEHVIARWGAVELRRVTHSGIAAWIADLTTSRSASTTRKALGVLRQVLVVAVADRRLAVNPATGIAQPRLPLADQRFLSATELTRLADATGSDRDRMLVLVLGWTGLRFGEAAGLTRGDLDILRRRIRVERAVAEVRGVIHVGSPKSHAARTVAMPAFLAEDLGRYLSEVPPAADSIIFPSKAATYLRVTTWKRRAFDTAAEAAELTPPSLRVHDLRHTAASLSIASGASVKLIQR
jgi:integrase